MTPELSNASSPANDNNHLFTVEIISVVVESYKYLWMTPFFAY